MTDIIEAHKQSTNNKNNLLKSKLCGCFYCLKFFNPTEITEWIDNDKTALCPYCDIDSIMPENVGYPITLEFLSEMKNHWFKLE